MNFKLFLNDKTLRKTFGEFADSLDNSDYKKFKEVLVKSKAWYVPASIFNSQDKTIKKLFNQIDGSTFNQNDNGSKNERIEQQELYDWAKYNYEKITGKTLTDEELKNMKMSEVMEIIEELKENFKL